MLKGASWFWHLIRMPPGRLPLEVSLIRPTGRRPPGGPSIHWRDYISHLTNVSESPRRSWIVLQVISKHLDKPTPIHKLSFQTFRLLSSQYTVQGDVMAVEVVQRELNSSSNGVQTAKVNKRRHDRCQGSSGL